jgi:carboxymethylenebutenolidase
MGEYIRIETDAGSFGAYLARPDARPAPAVVVLHEVFGVNADLRQTCDDLAGKGFIAVCPDLFWRQEPGVDLGVTSEIDWRHGISLYSAYNRELGVHDVLETVKAASRFEGASGKVALLGYCLGGLMVFLAAAQGSVDAAVAFHGADTEKYLDKAGEIDAPMLMHLAEEDEFISKAAQADIKAALKAKSNVAIISYKGCRHAFSRHGGSHYDPVAAVRANEATWSFLKTWLQ